MVVLIRAALIAILALTLTQTAWAAGDPVAECDRLAASPLDPMRPTNIPGVPFEQIDGMAAVKICTEAFRKSSNNARLEFELARALQKVGGPPDRIAALNREASERGSLLAAHNLSIAYTNGAGVPVDLTEAARLVRKAAEGGIPLSMRSLAERLFRGSGIDKNEAEALFWYRRGAEAGDATSMASLSSFYADGTFGVQRDEVAAFRWHEKAATAGWKYNHDLLSRLKVLDAMPGAQLIALKKRLADAKCYMGDFDSSITVELRTAFIACPEQRPHLEIETGKHISSVETIDVDSSCRVAITGSTDKTARLWSLPDGKLLRTFRTPIGDGNRGVISAVAISPSGQYVAVGGIDPRHDFSGSYSVIIFDSTNGSVVARVGGFYTGLKNLAFSPDGRWLAAMADGVGIIETSSWRLVAPDKNYPGLGFDSAFGPDGRLYTVAMDGRIRRYTPGPNFALDKAITTKGGKQPGSIAIDPKGHLLAIGYIDSNSIDLYDPNSLIFKGNAETGVQRDNGDHRVAWSVDGQNLIAGGNIFTDKKEAIVTLFDREGRRIGAPLPTLARNTIMQIKSCGDGYAIALTCPRKVHPF